MDAEPLVTRSEIHKIEVGIYYFVYVYYGYFSLVFPTRRQNTFSIEVFFARAPRGLTGLSTAAPTKRLRLTSNTSG